MKILFILKDRTYNPDVDYGITSGLYNSAHFVAELLEDWGFEVKLVNVPDSNLIDKEVTLYNPDVVIIEAIWVSPEKFKELFSIFRHKKRFWLVRVHSKAPFLAMEGIATEWIKEYTKIHPRLVVCPNTQELTEQLKSVFPNGKFHYLPNVYKKDKFVKGKKENKDTINIGCFGAMRPMKNTYEQAIAAIEFARSINMKLKFHINSTRIEQKGENVLKNIRPLFDGINYQLVEHEWLKHKDLLTLISQMDIGMQMSFSESFNIISADFVTAKVPIVASDDIDWLPGFLKTNPTNYGSILKKLSLAYNFGKIIVPFQTLYLSVYNHRGKIRWIEYIEHIAKDLNLNA